MGKTTPRIVRVPDVMEQAQIKLVDLSVNVLNTKEWCSADFISILNKEILPHLPLPCCWFSLNNTELVKATTLVFCNIQSHLIRDVCAKFVILYSLQSPDIGQNSDRSISDWDNFTKNNVPLKSPPSLGLIISFVCFQLYQNFKITISSCPYNKKA